MNGRSSDAGGPPAPCLNGAAPGLMQAQGQHDRPPLSLPCLAPTRSITPPLRSGRGAGPGAGAGRISEEVVVTSLVSEQFEEPSSRRGARRLELARRRAVEELAGRTIWSARALPESRVRAESLARDLDLTRESDVEASWIQVPAHEPLLGLARRLDGMLRAAAPPSQPDRADREVYCKGMSSAELLLGRGVALDDVVVLHDALAPALAHAVRGRGAHAVWQVGIGGAHRSPIAAPAWRFLRPYAAAIDAYLAIWSEPVGRGKTVQRVAALMPSLDRVTAKEIQPEQRPGLGWGSVLADVVHSDRGDRVGGTLRPRPAVPSR